MSRKNYPSFYAPDEIEAYAEELETIARTDLFVLKAQILSSIEYDTSSRFEWRQMLPR